MRLSTFLVALATTLHCTYAFVPHGSRRSHRCLPSIVHMEMTTMAESGVPPAHSEASDVSESDIPTQLPSAVGKDYVPLATMLATGQLAEADQVRDGLLVTTKNRACVWDIVI
jgi:hypothetical protein